MSASHEHEAFDPAKAERPLPVLLTYYMIVAALTVFGFPFVALPLYFKYHTLKYAFDDEGITMSWGILFRREISLTYRRIQDIHVTRNLVHRWLHLAAVAVQTASGSARPEMTIEGLPDPEGLRDFLYARMRGARGEAEDDDDDAGTATTSPRDEALVLLTEIRDALRARGAAAGEASQ